MRSIISNDIVNLHSNTRTHQEQTVHTDRNAFSWMNQYSTKNDIPTLISQFSCCPLEYWCYTPSTRLKQNKKSKRVKSMKKICLFIQKMRISFKSSFWTVQHDHILRCRGFMMTEAHWHLNGLSPWLYQWTSRPYHFKFFEGCLPQILLDPFLNTLIHL